MDMNLAKKFSALIASKRSAEDDLREIKQEIAGLEHLLLQEMKYNQMDRIHIGGNTLYIHRIMVAKPTAGDRDKVIDALKECGLDDLVSENYNSLTLNAWIRECLANGEQLPGNLSSVIDTEEIVSVRGRRSSSSPESKTAKARKTLEKNNG